MIQGNKKVVTNDENRVKKVGIFSGEVIKINPDNQWFSDNNMELKEGSRATEYLGLSKDGNRTARLDFWMKEKDEGLLFKAGYYVEDTDAVTQDGTKTYYINNQGSTSCVAKESDLLDWFKQHDYRVAKKGEKELCNFLKVWLSDIERNDNMVINLDLEKLFKGNYKELTQQINGEYCKPVVMAVTIKTVEKDGEIKEYQEVFNKAITYPSNIKYFRDKIYSEAYLDSLKAREANKEKIKGYEIFIKDLAGNYGTKNFFSLKYLHDYDPKENIVGKHQEIASFDDE